ncbi:hypothetical protein KJ784_01790, partial [Patescibacteria group bacterium]|nr:hypothetical protein [Patescibacteria group bacterium]
AHQPLPILRSRKFIVTPKTVSWSLGIIVIVFIIGYFFYQLNFLLSSPRLTILEPAQNDFVVAESIIIFKGQTEPGTKLTINGQQGYIDKDGNFEQTIGLVTGLNIIKVEAINRFGKSNLEVKRIMLK